MSVSWERGEKIILPGALAAAKEATNASLLLSLRLIEADSGPVTRYDLPYSGNVLEIIANLTWQNRVADIIGIAGLFHPNILLQISAIYLQLLSLTSTKSQTIMYIT